MLYRGPSEDLPRVQQAKRWEILTGRQGAAGSVQIPYQKYADDDALYTEVTTCTDGPDECAGRIAYEFELEDRNEWPLHELKARANSFGILPEGLDRAASELRDDPHPI